MHWTEYNKWITNELFDNYLKILNKQNKSKLKHYSFWHLKISFII